MKSDSRTVDIVVRLVSLGLIFYWCFLLVRPFVAIVLWSAILAIAWYPTFLRLKTLLDGRAKLAVLLLTLLGIGVIAGPVGAIGVVLAGNFQELASRLVTGSIVPPPPASVADWPLVGESVYGAWLTASVNLGEIAARFEPQLKEGAKISLSFAGNTGASLLKFIVSVIVAGAFTLSATTLTHGLTRFCERLSPGRGEIFTRLAAATIRNVVRGIIGVALVQSLMVGIGLVLGGIPAAGLLTLFCLFLAIVQIGPAPIVLGAIIYAWSTMEAARAIFFTLWMIASSLVDNVLKPLLVSRGLPVPMAVVIIGVFGGVLTHGLLGLFVGPVVLGLGYELLRAWINEELGTTAPPAPGESPRDG
jgi:predicted PurR-regulated permease PerM